MNSEITPEKGKEVEENGSSTGSDEKVYEENARKLLRRAASMRETTTEVVFECEMSERMSEL